MATEIEIQEQHHNGSNWETIPGAAWFSDWNDGETIEQAIERNAREDCDWSDGRDEPIRLVAYASPIGQFDRPVGYAEFSPSDLK